jgi:PAS domain-containing protein
MVNRMLRDILGYTAQELLTRTFADITHPGHVIWIWPRLKNFIQAGSLGTARKSVISGRTAH